MLIRLAILKIINKRANAKERADREGNQKILE
jgi:hypothetical protein